MNKLQEWNHLVSFLLTRLKKRLEFRSGPVPSPICCLLDFPSLTEYWSSPSIHRLQHLSRPSLERRCITLGQDNRTASESPGQTWIEISWEKLCLTKGLSERAAMRVYSLNVSEGFETQGEFKYRAWSLPTQASYRFTICLFWCALGTRLLLRSNLCLCSFTLEKTIIKHLSA